MLCLYSGWHAGVQVVQEAPPGQRTALVGFVAAAVRTTLKPHMTGPALATLTLLLTGALKGAVLSPYMYSAMPLPDSYCECGKTKSLPEHDRASTMQAEQSSATMMIACRDKLPAFSALTSFCKLSCTNVQA